MYSDAIKPAGVERILHLLCAFPLVLQEHVQGYRQPAELSSLLSAEEIQQLDRVTNRPYFIISKISRELRLIKDCEGFTARERLGLELGFGLELELGLELGIPTNP
jgi:predicted membrane chloride channel (bestrophin family)